VAAGKEREKRKFVKLFFENRLLNILFHCSLPHRQLRKLPAKYQS
jgi:hypothetical protein